MSRKRIEFNLASIYTALNSFDQALEWLDRIKNEPIIFGKLKEIAHLYSKIGLYFKSDPKNIQKCLECFNQAALNYAKCNLWSEYCSIELVHAKVLSDFEMTQESFKVAAKILSASMHLQDEIQIGKIRKNTKYHLF